MSNLKIKKQIRKKAANKYVRKVKVGGKCVDPTPENVRASKSKAFRLKVSDDMKRQRAMKDEDV